MVGCLFYFPSPAPYVGSSCFLSESLSMNFFAFDFFWFVSVLPLHLKAGASEQLHKAGHRLLQSNSVMMVVVALSVTAI